MSAISTMNISRSKALWAIAAIESAKLSDDELTVRLNNALRDGGYSLDEVSIDREGDDRGHEDIERMVESITR